MEFVGFKMLLILTLSLMGSVVNSKESSDYKLPTNFNPVSYRLDVTTYLDDKFMFEGVVDIQVSSHRRDTSYNNYPITICDMFRRRNV